MDMTSIKLAHDLKLPIQLIYSCVQLLEMELSPNARAEGYLQMLVRSADQLHSMVQGALEEEPASGETSARLKVRDVVALARESCRQCMPLAEKRSIRIHFETNAAGFRMPTDPEKLTRILNNLLSNALRFTPEHGHIGVSTHIRGDAVEFTVSDNGCGIHESRLEAIFEPGFSRDSTGYGLAIVREYAHALGGEVGVESSPGRGSRFTVRLPVPAPDCIGLN